MKKLIFIAAIISSLAYSPAEAQVRVNVNFNVGNQPVWGPSGYDYVQFYYLPDIGAYYNVSTSQFIYSTRGRWVYSNVLPPMYRNFDLYRSYKVVINEPIPWMRHNTYRNRYASYRGRHNQAFIRDSRDEKYWVIKNHPRHGDWQRNQANRGTNRGNNDRRDGNNNGRNDNRSDRKDDHRGNDNNRGGNNNNGHRGDNQPGRR